MTLLTDVKPTSLHGVLKLDAIVTGVNGAAYLLGAGPIGDMLGLPPTLLRVLGVTLAAYAVVVWVTATRPTVPRTVATGIAMVNAIWVVASMAMAIGGWGSPTALGVLWILAQAGVVACFAGLQAAALRR